MTTGPRPAPPPFIRRLFVTTPLEGLRDPSRPAVLRRALRARDLIAVGLGSMIGGGIFTTIGPGVKLAGPAIIVAFLLAGLAAFFAALCYAELGAMVPIAGSAYTYAYATLGQLVAWLIGFSLLFEYGVSAAPVAQQFSRAFQSVLAGAGLILPRWAQGSHLIANGAWWDVSRWDFPHSQYDVVGAAFILMLSVLLSIGIRETATTNNVFVVLKVLALVVFVIAGATLFHPANLAPFAPLGWGSLAPFSGGNGSGIIPAAALVFFSYIGFDTATTTAEECRRPQRDVPVGVLGALGIGTLIYVVTAIVLVGVVPWREVDENQALAAAVAPLHNVFVNAAITVGVLAGTTSVAIGSLLGQTRIFYVMARDRMLPPFVARVNPRFQDAGPHDDDHRHRRGDPDAHRPARRSPRPRQHRDALRVRDRLRGGALPAQDATRHPASVPRTVRASVPAARHLVRGVPRRVRADDAHLGALRHLPRDRPRDLFPLRIQKVAAVGAALSGLRRVGPGVLRRARGDDVDVGARLVVAHVRTEGARDHAESDHRAAADLEGRVRELQRMSVERRLGLAEVHLQHVVAAAELDGAGLGVVVHVGSEALGDGAQRDERFVRLRDRRNVRDDPLTVDRQRRRTRNRHPDGSDRCQHGRRDHEAATRE